MGDGVVYCDAFMQAAFAEARIALAEGEVPVGCVFVCAEFSCAGNATLAVEDAQNTGLIAARGRNATNNAHHALAHAEFVAADALLRGPNTPTSLACYVLYVTVEPCIMCAAMLLYNRIHKVFYGCGNPRFGGNGTVLSVQKGDGKGIDGYISCGGHRAEEAIELLQDFYRHENANAPGHKRKRKETEHQQKER